MYYWDGHRWTSTLSPDGRHRWNGSTWEPVPAVAYAPEYHQSRPQLRRPTSWTRPLQYAVIARYATSAIYGLFVPLLMRGYMSQVMQQSLRQQRQSYPPGVAPPPGFVDMMNSIVAGSLWVGAIIGLTLAIVVIVATIKRWSWAYYAILVLVGFTLLGTVYNLIDLFSGGALRSRQAVQPPEWTRVFAYGFGFVDIALFVWMLIALIRRGPWAMRRVSPA